MCFDTSISNMIHILPVARKHNVTANRSAGEIASRSMVSLLAISGFTFARSPLNIALSIRK